MSNRKKVLAIEALQNGEWWTSVKVAEHISAKQDTIRSLLSTMVKDGYLHENVITENGKKIKVYNAKHISCADLMAMWKVPRMVEG